MLKTIQSWWSAAWVVRAIERMAALIAAIARGCFLGRLMSVAWDDLPAAYAASRCCQVWLRYREQR